MALAYNYFLGDGVTKAFAFSKELNTQATVVGYSNAVLSAGTWDLATLTFTFTVAPISGADVYIVRKTDNNVAVAAYPNKSYINSANLDGDFRQSLMQVQELEFAIDQAVLLNAGAPGYAASAALSAAAALASEVSATAAAVAAALSESNAAASEAAALASKNAAAASELATAADALATAADVLVTAANVTTTNANAVITTQDALDTAADVVLTHADVVLTHADVVITNADAAAASLSATNALASEGKAQLWADETHNVAVEPGLYSAKHWATEALLTVAQALQYRGVWDASTAAYPVGPSTGDLYKVSVAGTISGTVYDVGDNMLYNGTTWDKIDNTEQVTSVAGRVGAITLTSADLTDDAFVLNTGDTLTGNLVAKTVSFPAETANTGTTPTVSWLVNQKQNMTVTAATTVTFTAPVGPSNLLLKIINGGLGVITWPATVKWAGGAAPTDWTSAGTDIATFYFDGTNYHGMAGIGFA